MSASYLHSESSRQIVFFFGLPAACVLFVPDDRIVAIKRDKSTETSERGERGVGTLADSVKKRRGGRSEVFLCLWPESSHNQLTEDKKTGEATYDTKPHGTRTDCGHGSVQEGRGNSQRESSEIHANAWSESQNGLIETVAGSEIQNRGRNKVQHSAKEEEKTNEKMLVTKTDTCRHILSDCSVKGKAKTDKAVTIDGKGKEETRGSAERAKIKGRVKTRRKDNWKSAW
ncbi:hypothetical protein EI94DRAFT_1701208 [Lactarius quietus]|nr:hypothetical protein EI94DRAFT_1701208 [Lactarius quietus]